MPGDLEAMTRRLVDEADVSKVVLRYADGVDRRDWGQVRACFAPDAMIEGTQYRGPRDEYLAQLQGGVEHFGATMHLMANQLVEVEADAAHTETYAVAYHFRDPSGRDEQLVVGVRYVDDLVRSGGCWVISRRVATPMWMQGPLVQHATDRGED